MKTNSGNVQIISSTFFSLSLSLSYPGPRTRQRRELSVLPHISPLWCFVVGAPRATHRAIDIVFPFLAEDLEAFWVYDRRRHHCTTCVRRPRSHNRGHPAVFSEPSLPTAQSSPPCVDPFFYATRFHSKTLAVRAVQLSNALVIAFVITHSATPMVLGPHQVQATTLPGTSAKEGWEATTASRSTTPKIACCAGRCQRPELLQAASLLAMEPTRQRSCNTQIACKWLSSAAAVIVSA